MPIRCRPVGKIPTPDQPTLLLVTGWPGTDPKAWIIWEAFKPESEPRRTIREEEIKPIKTQRRQAAPTQKGKAGRTDSDFLDDRGGII